MTQTQADRLNLTKMRRLRDEEPRTIGEAPVVIKSIEHGTIASGGADQNDYLLVTPAAGGDAVKVAKPQNLRHDAAQYEKVQQLTTVDAQTVDVTLAGGATERWRVTRTYEVGQLVLYTRVGDTGVEVDGKALALLEVTGDRVWGREWP